MNKLTTKDVAKKDMNRIMQYYGEYFDLDQSWFKETYPSDIEDYIDQLMEASDIADYTNTISGIGSKIIHFFSGKKPVRTPNVSTKEEVKNDFDRVIAYYTETYDLPQDWAKEPYPSDVEDYVERLYDEKDFMAYQKAMKQLIQSVGKWAENYK